MTSFDDPRPSYDPATPDLHQQWSEATLDGALSRLALNLDLILALEAHQPGAPYAELPAPPKDAA